MLDYSFPLNKPVEPLLGKRFKEKATMSIGEKQIAQGGTVSQRTTKVEFVVHPARGSKAARGNLKFMSSSVVGMFFNSQERGVNILKAASSRKMVLADDAQVIELAIMSSGLPEKETEEVSHFELYCRDNNRSASTGAAVHLFSDEHLVATAECSSSIEDLKMHAEVMIDAYDIQAETAGEMMRVATLFASKSRARAKTNPVDPPSGAE